MQAGGSLLAQTFPLSFSKSVCRPRPWALIRVRITPSNIPIFLVPISPVDACQYIPDNFAANVESIFIPDAKKDMERAMATVERNIKREEDLANNVATDDLLLFGAAEETTATDKYVAKQYKEDKNAFVDPKEGAMRKAILAAKSNNVAEMEDALEEAIPINTADQFGNTLLILAAQQGSKRMCKFLLDVAPISICSHSQAIQPCITAMLTLSSS